ncbi:lysosomal protective protein-like [Oppia nitens]|uniref:lysosomal protective protein-like n=1 Tax=Oppia nitens TaxID=1686743 RepID=UPI0023D9E824|nr:lysosomal protective protein-like [Oppia nitens]
MDFAFILLVLNFAIVFASNDDLIGSLPGLTEPIKFKQYSGYLTARPGRHHFYWFVESETDPANAPVVLWLTGGPGCSSVFGMLTENGPFHVNSDGKTVALNTHSWNKVANVIYMESPVSTGFSYEDNQLIPYNTDVSTAEDNYLALESFFVKYPHLKKNPFYIVGESYGGVYVPMLSLEIFKRNSTINFKGAGVGNSLLDGNLLSGQHMYDFALGHGLITTDYYEKKIENCCEFKSGPQHQCDFDEHLNNTKCQSVPVQSVSTPNPYNIYDDCFPDLYYQTIFNKFYKERFERIGLKFPIGESLKLNGPEKLNCPHDGHSKYLNIEEVRKALHVKEGSIKWVGCGGAYDRQKGYTPQHENVLQLVNKYSLGKFVVYNGDFDIMCDFISDSRFVDNLELKKTDTYKQWTNDGTKDGDIGGFVQHYEKGVSFVLVRGAGHMVPQDKPEAGLQVFKYILGLTKL